MSDKIIIQENEDEIIKNVVKEMKKGKKFSNEEIDKLMAEANENLEFTKVLDDIKLASPDNRVIFVDGNENLIYDHGEFFICDTTDSREPKKKIKRKEATEKYIEYFIRYQLNPIIEQKNMYSMSKTITKTEVERMPQDKSEVAGKKPEKKAEGKQNASSEKFKVQPKKDVKTRDELTR